GRDGMSGALLGPEFPPAQIREYLDAHGLPYQELPAGEWAPTIAKLIGDENSAKMQSVMNLKIKYRESFRPFAPSVLEERVADYFELDRPSPYMLLVADVVEGRRIPKRGDERDLPLTEWVNRPRSDVPAITHVDYSARIQTVGEESPRYHAILQEFEK